MATRKLYPSEIIKRLESLNKRWHDDIMLFAASDTLCLINTKTGKELASFENIRCDGGDPEWDYDEKGNAYLHLYHDS